MIDMTRQGTTALRPVREFAEDGRRCAEDVPVKQRGYSHPFALAHDQMKLAEQSTETFALVNPSIGI